MADDPRRHPNFLLRIILVMVGINVAVVGFVLVMSVFLSFIGLPLFAFGMALAQAQDS